MTKIIVTEDQLVAEAQLYEAAFFQLSKLQGTPGRIEVEYSALPWLLADPMTRSVFSALVRYGIIPPVSAPRKNWSGYNFEDACLAGSYLDGVHLCEANLFGASLDSSRLRGANLWRADLGGASLRHCDLRGANLSGANLRGASLSSSDLRGADLTGALRRPKRGNDGDWPINGWKVVGGRLVVR